MHKFTIDFNVSQRFLEHYVTHLISKYLLRELARLHVVHDAPQMSPPMLDIQVHADCTSIVVTGLPDFTASTWPDTGTWTPLYAVINGMTVVQAFIPWTEPEAPTTLELTVLDQDLIARGVQMGYGQCPILSEHDEEFFTVLRECLIPALAPTERVAFELWHGQMCEQARHNRIPVITHYDEAPFFPNNQPFGTPASRINPALRMMDGRITSIDMVDNPIVEDTGTYRRWADGSEEVCEHPRSLEGRVLTFDSGFGGVSAFSSGPRSRQQFQNNRHAPSRGKKGRIKMHAGKNGSVYPKPGGHRGY